MVAPSETLLQRLEWTVLRRLDGLLQGDYRTLYRGLGVDLADLREYQYHDDVRHIDWNVTARLQVPHVRQFVEDREVNVWFLVDLTQSMHFGSGTQRKSDNLLDYIGVLARVMAKHGNHMGAMIYRGGSKIDHIVPVGSGRKQVLRLLDELMKPKEADSAKLGTDLTQFFSLAGSILKRRSVVFVASDFISKAGWEGALGKIARSHEVIVLRSEDALEAEMPDLGLITLQDAETGEQLLVDTHSAPFRSRFASLATARKKQIESQLAATGVDCLQVGPIEDLVAFALKRKRFPKRLAR